MFLVVPLEAKLEAVLVLKPPHVAKVPRLHHGSGAGAAGPAQGAVGGQQVVPRARVPLSDHQRPLGVQRLSVIPAGNIQ